MLIRRLCREDIPAANEIRAISFHQDLEERKRKAENMTDEKLSWEWGCFNDEGRLMSCIRNNRFIVWLDDIDAVGEIEYDCAGGIFRVTGAERYTLKVL